MSRLNDIRERVERDASLDYTSPMITTGDALYLLGLIDRLSGAVRRFANHQDTSDTLAIMYGGWWNEALAALEATDE